VKLEFQRFGGFAPGVMNRAPRYVAELSGDDAEKARALLPANFRDLTSSPPPTRDPSAFRYEIVVGDGGDEHRVVLSESDVPDSLRPFLEWVSVRAGL
jgi:hypothetical protein